MNAITKERLLIFTRYPEPGKTKTRLIPTLGAKGAATLQQEMTEHTLSKARELQKRRLLSLEVRFTGGSLLLMQNWLGSDIIYQPQGDGNLGARMARSLAVAFQDGIARVVVIGTDCPNLNADLIAEAFQQLHSHDLVIGPAIDGGYYLIGLNYLISELFIGINWGTTAVLQQTVDIAKKLNISVAYLPQLADVDRPEDLFIWEMRHDSRETQYRRSTVTTQQEIEDRINTNSPY